MLRDEAGHYYGTIFILFLTVIIDVNSILIPQGIVDYPKSPVWTGYLADPFIFLSNGIYYMVGTGSSISPNLTVFPSLICDDVGTWKSAGNILHVILQADQPSTYWAPEIAEVDNIFYMFYSVGFGEAEQRIRVTSSTSPLGPFNDSLAIELTNVTELSYAIDPHPFRDPKDGQWYLFYARDFLDTNDGNRIGTGVVVDRLINNMTRLAGNATTVIRPRHDWQLYQATRTKYNQTSDWYTIEAPATWQEQSGSYICFYSGGNWQNETYGVDYAYALSSILGPYIDNSTTQPRVTHYVEGVITGPGSNSVILGNDKQTSYIIYHGWNEAMTIRSPYVRQLNWETTLPNNSSSSQDLLHLTLLFLVYLVIIFLIFHHAI